MVKSLTGSGNDYYPVQVRVRGGMLHFQARGAYGNRDYGAAYDSQAEIALLGWLLAQDNTSPSLAGSGKAYVPAQAKADGDGGVHVQVAGKALNRTYGASFNLTGVDACYFAEWLDSQEGEEDSCDESDNDADITVATLA